MTCNLRTVNFFLWTVRSFTDRTNSTNRYSVGILDNSHFQMLDLFFKFLSAHHECNVVVYGLSCAKEATNKISTWCQPFRNIYNYTDYGNGTDGWKLYSVARDCVEVDDLCLSKERCKKTTQKYWHFGCLGNKLSVLSKTSAEKMTFSWDIFLSMGHFVLL